MANKIIIINTVPIWQKRQLPEYMPMNLALKNITAGSYQLING